MAKDTDVDYLKEKFRKIRERLTQEKKETDVKVAQLKKTSRK